MPSPSPAVPCAPPSTPRPKQSSLSSLPWCCLLMRQQPSCRLPKIKVEGRGPACGPASLPASNLRPPSPRPTREARGGPGRSSENGGRAPCRKRPARRRCRSLPLRPLPPPRWRCRAGRSSLLLFRPLLDAFADLVPAAAHPAFHLFWNRADRVVVEHDLRPRAVRAQPVLHVVGDRMREHERAEKFEQRRPLDRLHLRPVVPIALAEVPVPAPAGPSLDLHAHIFAFAVHHARAELLEQRLERLLESGVHVDLFGDAEDQVLNLRGCYRSAHRHVSWFAMPFASE